MRELKSVDKLAMSQRARNNLPAGLTLGSFTAGSSVMTDVLPLSALVVGEHSSIAVAAVLNQLGATLIQHAENGAAALVLMRDRSYDPHHLGLGHGASERASAAQIRSRGTRV